MVFLGQLLLNHHGRVLVASDETILCGKLGAVSWGTGGPFTALLGDGTGDGGIGMGEGRKRGVENGDDPVGEEARRTKGDWSTAAARCVDYARIVA